MIKNLKYIDIEYTNADLEYIDYISKIIDERCENIVNFFELDKYEDKTYVKLFDDLDEFRKYFKEVHNYEAPKWVCGFDKDKNVYTLSLNEYRKTKTHENDTLDDMICLVLHEFTHAVHERRHKNILVRKWLAEGAATYLSGQYKDVYEINCSYEDILEHSPYTNYRALFAYVLENYGKEYILKLIDDEELLKNETERLFEEVSNISRKKD